MYNVPLHELQRSPSANIVGKLAADSGLFLTHFEHRHHLSLAPHWLPPDRPDLSGEVTWNSGVLREHKYLHFRYDQPLGSFHPGHRAKWTAHELCHGLVGFCWRPDMTPLSHSLSARLSELLPVALWYFFDEVQLRRCPLHYLQGALFQDHCVYCEDMARHGPRLVEPEDEKTTLNGLAFVKAELAMIAKSKRFGRPLPHRYATLDLNSDALAYVAQNLRRMEDPVFRMFIEMFHGHHTGMWADLDELEGRVWGVCEALSGGLPANPLPAGSAHWIAQDLGWRLLSVSTLCEDREAVTRLEELAEGLARDPEDLSAVFSGYHELYDAFFLPEPEEVFAVGYPLVDSARGTSWGSDHAQLFRGVDSACPSLVRALGVEGLTEQIPGFAAWDLAHPERRPIGKRFARYLEETADGPLADLARYEAALQHPEPPDPWSASLSWHSPEGELVRRAQGVEVLKMSVEVDALIQALERDDEEADIPEREHWILICNQPGGVRRLTEVSAQAAYALNLLGEGPIERRLLNLNDEDWETLLDAGALTPCSWHLYVPEVAPARSPAPSEELLPDAFTLTASRGLWRQAQLAPRSLEDDEEVGLEPASVELDQSPSALDDEGDHLSSFEAPLALDQASALRSLQSLNGVIEDVRLGRPPQSNSRLKSKRPVTTRPAPSLVFSAAPQISTGEALEELGYRADRPPLNPFEEQLRRALDSQGGVDITVGESPSADDEISPEELEGLFRFDGLFEGRGDDELDYIEPQDMESEMSAQGAELSGDPLAAELLQDLRRARGDQESQELSKLERYLEEARIQAMGDDLEEGDLEEREGGDSVRHREGQSSTGDVPSASRREVGFGARWSDWDEGT